METEIGVELTTKEIKLIKSLERLAEQWEKDGKDLWLFSASSDLFVMLKGDTPRNPEIEMNPNQGLNQNNIVTLINGIRNDGGDW